KQILCKLRRERKDVKTAAFVNLHRINLRAIMAAESGGRKTRYGNRKGTHAARGIVQRRRSGVSTGARKSQGNLLADQSPANFRGSAAQPAACSADGQHRWCIYHSA